MIRGFNEFADALAELLKLDNAKAARLAELLEDRMKELGDDRWKAKPDPWDGL